MNEGPVIYFYCKNKEVVYIGMTNNIITRHKQHINKYDLCLKDYDSLTIQYYSSKIILPSIELFYISLFQPIFNRTNIVPIEENFEEKYWNIISDFFIKEENYSKEELLLLFPYNEKNVKEKIKQKEQKSKNKGGRKPINQKLIQEIKDGLITGKYKNITEATKQVGIARATYYKYKDN